MQDCHGGRASEQRISFAYGNALNSELITKESVREAAQNMRLIRTP